MDEKKLIAVVEVVRLGPIHERLVCEHAGCENEITATMRLLLVANNSEMMIWCDDHL